VPLIFGSNFIFLLLKSVTCYPKVSIGIKSYYSPGEIPHVGSRKKRIEETYDIGKNLL
jgi:hypothetical protein